jgi:alkaline phosphatase
MVGHVVPLQTSVQLKTMNRFIFSKYMLAGCFMWFVADLAKSQTPLPNAFAHNDYEQPHPLTDALQQGFAGVEADIHLINGELYVAHDKPKNNTAPTLKDLYLKPLQQILKINQGQIYPNWNGTFLFMIDIKTDATATYQVLKKQLKQFPELSHHPYFKIFLSGNRPVQEVKNEFPRWVGIDGRPQDLGKDYSSDFMPVISDEFSSVCGWNGQGEMPAVELQKIKQLADKVHLEGKKLRLWAIPDHSKAWATLLKAGVDLINSDKLPELKAYLNHQPTKVILMIGDGMGTSQIFAGLTANHGQLNLMQCQQFGFHLSQPASVSGFITDSAAGATAFATGQKTKNKAIGVDTLAQPLPTLMEMAEKQGISTGLVATCSITEATLAAFYAHQPLRDMQEEIALDFLKSNMEVAIGGGKKFFVERKDKKNLLEELKTQNYQITDLNQDFTKISTGKLLAFTADEHPKSMKDGRGNQLSKGTQTALQILNQGDKGFFLVVEGSQIDWGGHFNDAEYIAKEMIDFDEAIGVALDFAQKDGNTLVIITADHETGGLSITDGSFEKGTFEGKFSTKNHTGVMVPVFAYGAGAEAFSGIYQNTAIFDKIVKAFNLKK